MKTKKIICLTTSLILSLGFCVSCGIIDEEPSGGDGTGIGGGISVTDGVHIDNSVKTDGYFLKDGLTDYKILLPQNYTADEFFAADELINFFAEGTGVMLSIVYDNAVSNTEKYISIGNTTLELLGGTVGEELGNGGFVIKTVGDDIIIGSYKDIGAINGVYKLLESMLDYDYIYLDTYALNTGVKEIALFNYDVKEIPDIEFNDVSYKWISGDNVAKRRYQVQAKSLYIDGLAGHNSFTYVDPDLYLESNSEWFNKGASPTQLCYTAGGKSLDKMVETAFGVAKERLIADPTGALATFAIQDNGDYCECSACKAEYEKYGTNAAALIKFLNKLKTKIDEWFASEEGLPYKRDFTLAFYAYLNYATAPATGTGGNYTPIDASVKCIEGVVPRLAYLGANYTVPFTDEKNQGTYESIQKWRSVSDELMMYWYETNYHYYLAPYNCFNALQENYRLARQCGVENVYLLAQHTQSGASTGYGALAAYLMRKLGWNVNADVEALKDKFFQYYFEDAADVMYKQFTEYSVWSIHLENDLGNSGYSGVFGNPLQSHLWPQSLLEKWDGYYEDAFEAIEPLKTTNAARYQELYDHIACERLSTWYLYINLYDKNIDSATLLAMKREFKADVERLGMTRMTENKSISGLWTTWGI